MLCYSGCQQIEMPEFDKLIIFRRLLGVGADLGNSVEL
jgi:hypothetical protein